jgi:hypothetical protein
MNLLILIIVIAIGSRILFSVGKFAVDYALFLIVKSIIKLIFTLIIKSVKLIFKVLFIIYNFLFKVWLSIGFCIIRIDYKAL